MTSFSVKLSEHRDWHERRCRPAACRRLADCIHGQVKDKVSMLIISWAGYILTCFSVWKNKQCTSVTAWTICVSKWEKQNFATTQAGRQDAMTIVISARGIRIHMTHLLGVVDNWHVQDAGGQQEWRITKTHWQVKNIRAFCLVQNLHTKNRTSDFEVCNRGHSPCRSWGTRIGKRGLKSVGWGLYKHVREI